MKTGYATYLILYISMWMGFSQKANCQSKTSLLNYEWKQEPSVETFQMSRSGNHQHSLYTGAMTFSLPVCTYKDPDFEIPVRLDYKYDGYKIAMHSGSVGMGWFLNCGGVVTREIRGEMDECHLGYSPAPVVYGFWHTPYGDTMGKKPGRKLPGHYQGLDWTEGVLGNLFGGEPIFRDTLYVAQYDPLGFDKYPNEYDTAPDIFHFNFLGFTGDFIISNQDHSCKIYNSNVSLDRIKAVVEVSSDPQVHPQIKIRIDGYEYVFGGDNKHIEYTMTGPAQGMGPDGTMCPITAWRLSKITAPNGREVRFVHEDSYQYELSYGVSFTPDYDYHKESFESIFVNEHTLITNYEEKDVLDNQERLPYSSCSFRSPLKRIEIDGVTIIQFAYNEKTHGEFSPEAFNSPITNRLFYPPYDSDMNYEAEKRLSSISIVDPLETIVLTHTYSNNSGGSSCKMFLSEVESSSKGSYTFSYYNASAAFPPIDCIDTDHWGYWNGIDISTYDPLYEHDNHWKQIPLLDYHDQELSLYNIGSWMRNPDFAHTLYGALTSITYPTGGSTEIAYEQNTAGKLLERKYVPDGDCCFLIDNGTHFPVGGIRVKSMVDYNGTSYLMKRYTYHSSLSNSESSGHLLIMPRYALSTAFSGDETKRSILYDSTSFESSSKRVLASGIVTGISNQSNYGLINDNPIVYAAVQEHHPDSSVIEYRYFNWEDYPDSFDHEFHNQLYTSEHIITAPDSVNRRNRALTMPPSHDRSPIRGELKEVTWYDSQLSPIRKETYQWEISYPVEAMYWCNTLTSFTRAMQYGIWKQLKSKTETDYYQSQAFSRKTTYTYDNNFSLIKESITDPQGHNGQSIHYHKTIRNDRFGSSTISTMDLVEKFHVNDNGQEKLIAREQAVYAMAGNPHPTVIHEYVINPVLAYQSGRSRTTSFTYDDSGKFRLMRADLQGGRYVRYTWNQGWNNIISKEENVPGWEWQYTWYGLHKLTGKTEPSGISESYQYDTGNRLQSVKDTQGNKMEEYDYNYAHGTSIPDRYNYIRKKTYISTTGNYFEDITFYDGLGYSQLDVMYGNGGACGTIAKPYELDNMRRIDSRDYLPVPISGVPDDGVTPALITPFYAQHAYLMSDNETRPYTETMYGPSPVGEINSIQKPGGVYMTAGKKSLISRRVPDPQEEEIWGIEYDQSSSQDHLFFNVYQFLWVSGDLLCECLEDEDGKKTETFTDRFGKKILGRVWNGTEKLDTYYVYDIKDQLVCVIQPEGSKDVWLYGGASFSSEDDLAMSYCFLYVYDDDGRTIRKRIPGGCWQDFVYDNRDRLWMSTDESMNAGNLFVRCSYDALDRLITEEIVSTSALPYSDAQHLRDYVLDGAIGIVNNLMTVIQTLRACKYWGDAGFTSLAQGGMSGITGATFLKGLLAQEKVWEAPSADGTPVQNPLYTTRKFAYDYRGRQIHMTELDSDGWYRTETTAYDFLGNVTSRTESVALLGGMASHLHAEQWTYDSRGRVLTYAHSYNNTPMSSVTYQYDNLGRPSGKTYAGGKMTETFNRNLQGWLTGSYAKWGDRFVFSEDLRYYNPVKDTTVALYSGNISEVATQHQTGQLATNSYTYDGAGRLSHALLLLGESQTPVAYNGMRNIQYDRNGNITSNMTLDRRFTKLQSFSHTGNRLTSLTESFPQSTRPSVSSTFSYDVKGNLITDSRKGLRISYNMLNLPEKVEKTDSTDMAAFRYLYDGTKVAAIRADGTGTRYKGTFVIACSATGFPTAVKTIAWAEGVCAAKDGESGFGDYLYVKDHLGNVRDIVALYKDAATPVINVVVEKSDYLPFGERLSDMTSLNTSYPFTSTTATHRWHLGTKEEIPEGQLNLLDFGARYYDPTLCRWTSIDPLAEKYYSVSPYVYCLNNTILFLDSDGQSTHTNADGQVIYVEDDGDLGVYRHDTRLEGDAAMTWLLERYSSDNTAAGGEKMGESLHSLSFVDQNKYNKDNVIVADTKIIIDFGSYNLTNIVDNIIESYGNPLKYAFYAREGGDWDIKAHTQTGSLLYGKYASPRDAGNFAAGIVSAASGMCSPVIDYGYGLYNLSDNSVPMAIAAQFAIFSIPPIMAIEVMRDIKATGESPLSRKSMELGKQYYYSHRSR